MKLTLGIRQQITLLVLCLSVIPLLLVGSILGWQSFGRQKQQAIDLQRDIAIRTSNEIEDFVKEAERELTFQASLNNIFSMNPEEKEKLLAGVLLHVSGLENISLADQNGVVQHKVSRLTIVSPNALTNVANDEPFTKALDTNAVQYSPIWFDNLTNEPFITVAVPISDLVSGDFNGAFIVDIRLKQIQLLISDGQNSLGKNVYFLDSPGNVIAHPNPSVVLRRTIFQPPYEDGITEGLAGNSVVLAQESIFLGDQEYRLIVEESVAVALNLAISALILTIVVTILSLILALTVGFVATGRIVNPISELVDSVEAIERGIIVQTVEVRRQDELGILAKAFNKMSAQLQINFAALQQNVDALEQANRFKEEVLANVSHELRTPLAVIMLYSSMLADGIYVPLHPKQRKALNRIIDSANFLATLVNDLIDQARITAGKITLRSVPFVPGDMLETMQQQMEPLANNKGLALRGRIDSSLPETMVGDQERIQQILINLVNNAVKFTKEGEIQVEMKCHNEEMWQIIVADTGIGIPQAAQEAVFEAFEQADGSSVRSHGGVGLGLSIAKKLVELMDGEIRLRSDVGTGSTFIVTLPILLPEKAQKSYPLI